MSDRSDAAALSYLDRLLRMAVVQRGAPPDVVAGRVMIPVLGMALAYGGSELIAAYLTPEPEIEAIYQVRRQGPGDTEPAVLSDDLNAAAALRAAVRYSREGMGAIQVVGRTEAGVERRSIGRTSDGVLEYVFASHDAYRGPHVAVQTALRHWGEAYRRWATELGAGPPEGARVEGARPEGARPEGARPEGARAERARAERARPEGARPPGPRREGPQPEGPRPEGARVGWTTDDTAAAPTSTEVARRSRPDRSAVNGDAEPFPTATEIAAAIQASLMEMTVDINLNEVESLIRRTIQSTFGELTAASRPDPNNRPDPGNRPDLYNRPDPNNRPGGVVARPGGITPITTTRTDAEQLADRVGSRVVERIKPLLISVGRQAATAASASPARVSALDDRAAEQLAAMVAYQIDSFLQALSPDGLGPIEALKQIEPLLGEIDATQKQLLAQATSQVGFESRINSAMDDLSLQMQELREHTRTAAAAVQTLTEQVGALSRRSEASGERLAATVGRELDQFGDRFKHQLGSVESAAKRSARDMPVPEAVNRLTTRLARSEAQLRQILERLNELTPADKRAPEARPARGPRRAPQ